MIVRADDTLTIEVHLDIAGREEGHDDIRFALTQSGARETRVLPSLPSPPRHAIMGAWSKVEERADGARSRYHPR